MNILIVKKRLAKISKMHSVYPKLNIYLVY